MHLLKKRINFSLIKTKPSLPKENYNLCKLVPPQSPNEVGIPETNQLFDPLEPCPIMNSNMCYLAYFFII
jgi:hypothetical protein